MTTSDKSSNKNADLNQLDALTGGAFSAATSGDRAARLREWLSTDPTHEDMAEVFREMSHRDKGAAKALKEKLDELRRAKAQATIAEEWAARARQLLEPARLNLADAMAWQRDAAKAGAPLSREPLLSLKQALADRMKAMEELQHRVQVEREAAVLLAQRIEVLSTKPWQDAQQSQDSVRQDVMHWQEQVQALQQDPAWDALDPRYPAQLEASRAQLWLVWEAFDAALAQAAVAAEDAQAVLPAVPIWADEIRLARGETPVREPQAESPEQLARRIQAEQVVTAALQVLDKELAQGHSKALPKAVQQLRLVLKEHGRHIGAALEGTVQATLVRADELEGWQRWRADQLREELLAKAVALTQGPENERPSGRKMQEALRQLREQWKAADQGGVPNHGLWKKFDEACNQAHKVVEVWLDKVRQQSDTTRAQRLELVQALRDWTVSHADSQDWKAQSRELHQFADRWRQAGYLGERLFAELQPQWKAAMQAAHARLDQAQADSLARRQAMIEEAAQLGSEASLRVDAVKALQQRWQHEAQAVPLDRKQEQKLWEAFRQPIDAAFERKTTERSRAVSQLSAHDQTVIEAARALESACDSGDVAAIQAASQHLQQVIRSAPAAVAATGAVEAAPAPAAAPTAAPEVAARRLVAMRGDDRPGMTRAVPVSAADARRSASGRDARAPRDSARVPFERGPRLGDAAFRAQRAAQEHAEQALRRLAAQAHGEVLTQLLQAWASRDASALPAASALGRGVGNGRQQWVQALGAAPGAAADEALLRLEMAADVPTPAEHLSARRMLQLQLLTRRHEAAPADTWVHDVARVLASAHEAATSRRLQTVLKALLRR